MVRRIDISDKLIHFTRGNSASDAFATLRAIIAERRLIAGNRMIRGGYRCVCFTEAPLIAFKDAFVRGVPSTRYSQFGVMFKKSWVYERGGRPVIYQPDNDFSVLPEELRWRHVRYDLAGGEVIDWTWEREWRMRSDELRFSEAEAVVIVPNVRWADALRSSHHAEQDIDIEMYAMVLDREIAELWREPFRWRVVPLQ